MRFDRTTCDRARRSRDPRFDGRFFVGVLSTGIYCRPICPAPAAKSANVRYFPSAAAAAGAGLRPCLRCRPESAPGSPAWDETSATVARALRGIEAGVLDVGGTGDLARRLGVRVRHLGRLFQRHLGATPLAVAQTRRLLFAKQLLSETDLGMAQVAFAAGFGSVRRFNQVIRETYRRKPSELRARSASRAGFTAGDPLRLTLHYRPPYAWTELVSFLAPRAIPGVERVSPTGYRRTIRIEDRSGWIDVRPNPSTSALALTVVFPDTTALLRISTRVRRMFDLDSDPAQIASAFGADPLLSPLIGRRPGLRVPGTWDGFELAVRAVLGQQVTVRGATTLCGRLVEEYGEKIPDGYLFPRARKLARARFTRVGIPAARAKALRGLAGACASGEVQLEPGVDIAEMIARLRGLPGIGDWTAQYIAMRALADPDAFPSGDLGLRKAVALRAGRGADLVAAADLRRLAESWRPWRSYGAMHLWQSLAREEGNDPSRKQQTSRSSGRRASEHRRRPGSGGLE